MNRRWMILGGAVLAAVGIAVAWWLVSPLFIQESVDEAFPFDVPSQAEIAAMAPAEAETAVAALMAEADGADLSAAETAVLEDRAMAMAARMPDHDIADEMPAEAAWIVAASGDFRDFDEFHQGAGTATILQQGDRRVLRFEAFEVTNGPDLHVLLVENVDARGRDELGRYVDLGSLKGNLGDQNYEIPADVDLADLSGVMIYCMPFHVVFATAPLQ